MIEELLKKFKDNDISVQITLDVRLKPTVHAFHANMVSTMQMTEDETLVGALEKMFEKLIDKKGEKTLYW